MTSPEWSERTLLVGGSEVPVLTAGSGWLDGPVSAKERRRCLELINRDVIPALREHGKNLGLVSPFERQPRSRPLAREAAYEPDSDPAALREYSSAFGDPE